MSGLQSHRLPLVAKTRGMATDDCPGGRRNAQASGGGAGRDAVREAQGHRERAFSVIGAAAGRTLACPMPYAALTKATTIQRRTKPDQFLADSGIATDDLAGLAGAQPPEALIVAGCQLSADIFSAFIIPLALCSAFRVLCHSSARGRSACPSMQSGGERPDAAGSRRRRRGQVLDSSRPWPHTRGRAGAANAAILSAGEENARDEWENRNGACSASVGLGAPPPHVDTIWGPGLKFSRRAWVCGWGPLSPRHSPKVKRWLQLLAAAGWQPGPQGRPGQARDWLVGSPRIWIETLHTSAPWDLLRELHGASCISTWDNREIQYLRAGGVAARSSTVDWFCDTGDTPAIRAHKLASGRGDSGRPKVACCRLQTPALCTNRTAEVGREGAWVIVAWGSTFIGPATVVTAPVH